MIDSSTGEAYTHMYWTGFMLITCKNSIAGPIVNTQSVVVLVWIILGVSIKPGLCYDIPESLYGQPVYRTASTVPQYTDISVYRYTPMGVLCHVSMESFFLIGLASCKKVRANELAECGNVTEIMDFKQEIRDFSYGTSHGEKI